MDESARLLQIDALGLKKLDIENSWLQINQASTSQSSVNSYTPIGYDLPIFPSKPFAAL